jgi:Tfp pilus assembly protein PilV
MTRWRLARNGERGSILIEALVSTVLVGLALVTIIGTLSALSVAGLTAEDRSKAQAAARAQIAEIKAAPYQWNGDYSCCLSPVPAGLTRTIAVDWWNGSNDWQSWAALGCQDPPPTAGTPCQIGAQRITVTYASDRAPGLAKYEFVKVDR